MSTFSAAAFTIPTHMFPCYDTAVPSAFPCFDLTAESRGHKMNPRCLNAVQKCKITMETICFFSKLFFSPPKGCLQSVWRASMRDGCVNLTSFFFTVTAWLPALEGNNRKTKKNLKEMTEWHAESFHLCSSRVYGAASDRPVMSCDVFIDSCVTSWSRPSSQASLWFPLLSARFTV